MGKMVSQMFSGSSKRKAEIQSSIDSAKRAQEGAVAASRQQQEQAAANTQASLSQVRRTPRGRRQLVADSGSTLG